MTQWADWFAMNGDGVFVWPCYIVTVLVLVGNLLIATRNRRRLLEDIRLQIPMENSR
ncbi:MAG: heme exporter protein CcmD [Gammaproteobacteria bacterium]|nr:heme exporter protein CcmD [Gammaproteobacteria bacterium]